SSAEPAPSSAVSSETSSAESVTSSEAPASPEPAAAPTVPTADQLDNDTRVAILGDSEEGYGYIGVWAVDAAGCGVVDTPAATDFAVITRATFRDGPKAYFG